MAGPKLSLNAPFVNAQYLENSPPRKLSRRNPLIKSPSRCSIFTEKTSSYLLKLREYEFPLFELPAFELQHLLQQDVTNQSATGSYSVEDVAQQRPRPKFLRKKWWKDHLSKRRTKVASTDNQDKGDKRAQKEVDVPRLMFTPDIAVESLTHPADKPPTIRRRMATLMRGRSRSMPANEYSEMMFPHHENQRRSWKWLGSKANRSFNDEVRRLDEMGYISSVKSTLSLSLS